MENDQNHTEDEATPDATPEATTSSWEANDKSFICLPYKDGMLFAAVVFAAVAVGLSWAYWYTLIDSIGTFLLFLFPLFQRQGHSAVYFMAGAAVFSSAFLLCCAIFTPLSAWVFHGAGYWVSGLWLASAFCMFGFVRSGRHAALEKQYNENNNNENNNNNTSEEEAADV